MKNNFQRLENENGVIATSRKIIQKHNKKKSRLFFFRREAIWWLKWTISIFFYALRSSLSIGLLNRWLNVARREESRQRKKRNNWLIWFLYVWHFFAPPTLNKFFHSIPSSHMFEWFENERNTYGDDHLDKVPASCVVKRCENETFKWLFKKTLKSFRFQPTHRKTHRYLIGFF